jgi:hypothetical protein
MRATNRIADEVIAENAVGTIALLKVFVRIRATVRYEYYADNFAEFVHLACALVLLRHIF